MLVNIPTSVHAAVRDLPLYNGIPVTLKSFIPTLEAMHNYMPLLVVHGHVQSSTVLSS